VRVLLLASRAAFALRGGGGGGEEDDRGLRCRLYASLAAQITRGLELGSGGVAACAARQEGWGSSSTGAGLHDPSGGAASAGSGAQQLPIRGSASNGGGGGGHHSGGAADGSVRPGDIHAVPPVVIMPASLRACCVLACAWLPRHLALLPTPHQLGGEGHHGGHHDRLVMALGAAAAVPHPRRPSAMATTTTTTTARAPLPQAGQGQGQGRLKLGGGGGVGGGGGAVMQLPPPPPPPPQQQQQQAAAEVVPAFSVRERLHGRYIAVLALLVRRLAWGRRPPSRRGSASGGAEEQEEEEEQRARSAVAARTLLAEAQQMHEALFSRSVGAHVVPTAH
jgi:hypothetical protein